MIEQKAVRLMRALDGNIQLFLQSRRAGRVIDVAVGQQNFLNDDAVLRDGGPDEREIAPRIDDSAALGLVGPNKGAILLKGCDGDDGGAKI
jgi:hypothetical protein